MNYNLDIIKDMIQKDLNISQQLLTLLKKETPLIQHHDYQAIKHILLDKAPLLDQLKRHADLRKEWLLSLYKVADKHHWNTFLASFNTPEIEAQWAKINENIAKCKALNETNGIMINRGQKTYSQLLQLLKGGSQSTELYNAKGGKQSNSYSCQVTKA
ncbi:hypothetical protein AB835_07025 [Candidatus Endobugula sertula]|uniref:Flagellar biosynthesis protein FlgN n=1 Tax=Candidatus Endobugula sertula TaxID=62101 RepID=A0A1D2QQE8_9GAMM|nr:hypothetical protein AB835_07025 [Candidatus Endobugula sertula]